MTQPLTFGDAAERDDVADRRHAARGDDAQVRAKRAVERERRPAHHAVFADVGDERLAIPSSSTRASTSASDDVASRSHPPTRTTPSRTSIAAMTRSAPRSSTIARRTSGASAATVPMTTFSAPASIHVRASSSERMPPPAWMRSPRVRQSPHDVRLDRMAAARCFEVDDVQPRSARDVERIEHRLRIAVRRHVGEVAAQQADDVAAEEVEGRDHVHAMKFLSTRSPAADDFSG